MIRYLIDKYWSFWSLKRLCQKNHISVLNKILFTLYRSYLRSSGCFIASSSIFNGIPCMPHGMNGIFISGSAIIGCNCVMFHQVTIGSNTLPESKGTGAPIIGDNCYIGAGAKIIGRVKVGNNVRIGANTVVYKDVPDNVTVISGEQKMLKYNVTLNNKYYTYHNKWVFFNNGRWEAENNMDIVNKLNTRLR